MWLAGDIHNYRRDTSVDGNFHKLICGGGGAFLHPTGSGINSHIVVIF